MADEEFPELVEGSPSLARVAKRELAISGRRGPLEARQYLPEGSPNGARVPTAGLVWFHGGGFIGGDLDMPEAELVALSIAAEGFVVISGDYAKCIDGVHYPTPNEDVLDTWRWCAEHAGDLGVDSSRLHLGGASAGAALAATLAKQLRDGAGVPPRSLVLAYPPAHQLLPEPDPELRQKLDATTGFVITVEIGKAISDNYLGHSRPCDDPYAFPAAGDLSGLPPTLILNSEIDTLRASGEAFGEELQKAGVEVRVECEPGALHGHLNEPHEPPGVHSIATIVEWLTSQNSRR